MVVCHSGGLLELVRTKLKGPNKRGGGGGQIGKCEMWQIMMLWGPFALVLFVLSVVRDCVALNRGFRTRPPPSIHVLVCPPVSWCSGSGFLSL